MAIPTEERIAGISLCSGIGGLDLGIAQVIPTFSPVCYVEGETYCASVLVTHMEAGRLDPAPIWSDVRTFDGAAWRGKVDIISAGYPCQPFSVAGRGAGEKDPRHIWPHIARIIEEVAPSIVVLENVPGHVRKGLQSVCSDLYQMGFHVRAGIFSAAEVGAPHIRKRLFVFAYANSMPTLSTWSGTGKINTCHKIDTRRDGQEKHLANANSLGCRKRQSLSKVLIRRDGINSRCALPGEKPREKMVHSDHKWQLQSPGVIGTQRRWACDASWWKSEPRLGRVVDGCANRVDRLRALGNAVVPATAALALRTLMSEAFAEV